MIFIAGFMLLEYGETEGRGVMCVEENRKRVCVTPCFLRAWKPHSWFLS